MEKDKLPEWLKGQAKQFELTPQQGSFDVLMHKRQQQRKQRKLFVWLSMSAVVAMVMSIGIWFATNRTEPVAIAQKQSTEIIPLKKDGSTINNVGKEDTEKGKRIPDNQTSDTYPAKTVPAIANDVPVSTTNTSSSPKTIAVKQRKSSTSKPPVSTRETPQKEQGVTTGITQPIVNPMQANIVAPSTPSGNPDSIPVKALLTDSMPTAAAGDSSKQNPGDPSMEVLSVKPAAKQSYWSIIGVFTPQLINGVYNTNSYASLSWMKKYIENREQNDEAQYSFNAGLKVERTFGKHWSVSTGLFYSMVKFEEIKLLDPVPPEPPSIQGLAAGENTTKRAVAANQNSLDISFSSLEIPLQVGYRLSHKNWYYQVTAGVSYAYLFNTRSLIFDEKDSLLTVQETNDAGNGRLTQHSVILLGGTNIGYFFSKRWSCYAGPVFRYSIQPVYNKDYFVGPQPYYLGLELGIKYSFR